MILDASQPIRELVAMDPTIEAVRDRESLIRDPLKTFESVTVTQIKSAGGRHKIEASAAADRKVRSLLAKEITELVRENWQSSRGVLLFTFKRRGDRDLVSLLRQDVADAGFDLDAQVKNDKGELVPKLVCKTYGDETSLNGLEYCDAVILVGVLHLPYLTVAAKIKGQQGSLSAEASNSLIQSVVDSEVAHVIYQGASRGACRRMTNGKAHAMKLFMIHRDAGIKRRLDVVMPGAAWQYRDPVYLVKAKQSGVVEELAATIIDHLRELPMETVKVSSQKVKARLELPDDDATRLAFGRASKIAVSADGVGWAKVGGSFVRRTAEYHGFESEAAD